MNVSDQIVTLLDKHATLEQKLAAEHENSHPDPAMISDIKKKKLRIKDQIATLDGN